MAAQVRQRREATTKAQNMNLKLNSGMRERQEHERKETLREKDNIQTSIKSKVEDDAIERFRQNMRKATVMDVFKVNLGDCQTFAETKQHNRNKKLEDEQDWLNQIKDAQIDEANYHQDERRKRITDLRYEYKEQADQKRDCERNFVKFP